MDMQDNEFDGLFRDKLDGFESQPSERVWTGIDTRLEGKKRSILPWLSIAASIIVLVSAGIWFIPKAHQAGHKGEGIAMTRPKPAPVKPAAQVAVVTTPAKRDISVKPVQKISTVRHTEPVVAVPAPVKPAQTLARNEQVKKMDEQPAVLTAVVTPKTDQAKPIPVVPDKETPLVVKHVIDTATGITKPALIAKTQPELKPETPAVKKHGIRSFGDLVNLVVARVDKRKDKAVQFTDDEDGDGSTLTAVNIGPLKLRKDDKGDK